MGIIQRQSIKGTLVFIIGAGIHFFSMMILMPKLIPNSSPEQAIYRVYASLILLFSVLGTGGIGTILLKHLADFDDKPNEKKAFNTITFIYALVFAALNVLVIYLCKDILYAWKKTSSPYLLNYFWVIPFASFFFAMQYYFESYSIASHRLTAPSVVKEIVLKVILLIDVYLFGTNKITAEQFFIIYAVSFFVAFLILSIYCIFIKGFRLSFEFSLWKKIKYKQYLSYLFYMFFVAILGALIINLDQPVIYGLAGVEATNYYGLAVTAASMITIPYKPLSSILLPFMYEAWKKNDIQKLNQINMQSSVNLTAIGVLLFLGLVINIQVLIHVVGVQYQPIVIPIIIIGLGRVLDYTTGTSTELIYSAPSHKKMVLFLIATFLFSLMCYYIFIPQFKAIGAAISCTLTLIFFNVLKYVHLNKHYNLQPLSIKSFICIGLGIVLFALHFYLPHFKNLILDFIIRNVVLLSLYILAIYKLQFIPEFNQILNQKIFKK